MCAVMYTVDARHLVKATEISRAWRVDGLVTCGLTACTPGSARGPALGNEYGRELYLYVFYVK